MFKNIFAIYKSIHVTLTDNPVLADVTGVLCCVGGATGQQGGRVGKIFC